MGEQYNLKYQSQSNLKFSHLFYFVLVQNFYLYLSENLDWFCTHLSATSETPESVNGSEFVQLNSYKKADLAWDFI